MHGCICLVVDGQMGLHLNWDWEGGGGGGGGKLKGSNLPMQISEGFILNIA